MDKIAHKAMTTLAKKLKLHSHELDDLVHDIASQHASRVNNEGLESQIEYLLEEMGFEDVSNELGKLRSEQS